MHPLEILGGSAPTGSRSSTLPLVGSRVMQGVPLPTGSSAATSGDALLTDGTGA